MQLKVYLTMKPIEAKQYEHEHKDIKLRMLRMHMDGTDTYEMVVKDKKSKLA